MASNYAVTRNIPKDGELHRLLVKRLTERTLFGMRGHTDFVKKWQLAEEQTLAYIPESEEDAIRRSAREQRGNQSYVTIQIPYSYALLMAAHTYWTSVFFARAPVHQFAGRHGESEQQVMAVEALIAYQVEVGAMLAPYYIWLYDAGKYGHGVLGTYWEEETIQYSNVRQLVNQVKGTVVKAQETIQIPGYCGNKVYNIAPYDFFHDPLFPIGRFQEGEYCGVHKVIGWNEALRRKHRGFYNDNLLLIKDQCLPSFRDEGSSALRRPEQPSAQIQTGDVADPDQHPPAFHIFEVYVDLIQKEWRLGDSDFPEKWVFSITGDLGTVIGAQPLGAMHGRFPFDIVQSEVEGYGLYTRGIPETIKPIQNTMDWLINTHFYNVRAAMNNQFVIDPSKVVVSDAEDGGPGFVWRLRPEAYGSDIRSFFYQIPVQDMTRGHIADVNQMLAIGERVMGINDQMFGAFTGGGRKTATEVRTSTGFGVNRLKTVAEYMSASAFSPHAYKLISLTQQWYEAPQKLKIVGELAQLAGPQFMMVNPEMVAGNYDFVPVDGTLPIDRMAMANLWQQIMGQMRAFPPLMAQFDIGKIFTHVAYLGGIRNINQFKIQVVPNGLLQMQAQQGNVVPMQGGGAPNMMGQVAPPPGPIDGLDMGDGGDASAAA